MAIMKVKYRKHAPANRLQYSHTIVNCYFLSVTLNNNQITKIDKKSNTTVYPGGRQLLQWPGVSIMLLLVNGILQWCQCHVWCFRNDTSVVSALMHQVLALSREDTLY